MKKILEITISTIITGAILFGLLSIFIPFWMCAYAYILVVPIIIISFIIGEYLTIKNIKKAFLLVRYKRVKEINLSCEGCVFNNNNQCKKRELYLVEKCNSSNTIFANRSYNIFKWIKKLFILCVISILCVSCVTININLDKQQKDYSKEAQKLEQRESAWY